MGIVAKVCGVVGCPHVTPAERGANDYLLLRHNIAQYLAAFAATVAPGSIVIEVGVGPHGSHVKPYLRDGACFIGTDRARHDNVDCYWDIMDAVPPALPPADTIVASEVLEHVRDPWVAMTNLRSALKVGGCIVVTVPFMFREHEPEDLWRFTRAGLEHLARYAGFSRSVVTSTWAPWQGAKEPLNLFLEAWR